MEQKTNIAPTEGVMIPAETVAASTAKKRAHRTLRQLPLYRDMSNLKYLVVKLYDSTPRKLTKFLDGMTNTAAEAKKTIGLAEATHSTEERAAYLTMARVFVEDVQDDVTILRQLGVLGAATEKRMKSLGRSIVAQCIGWRDYENSQGAECKVQS